MKVERLRDVSRDYLSICKYYDKSDDRYYIPISKYFSSELVASAVLGILSREVVNLKGEKCKLAMTIMGGDRLMIFPYKLD